jgi:hypothetical protein
MGLNSVGTWAVSVAEVAMVECTAFADPEPASPQMPANHSHAVIDFEGFTGNQQKKIGGRLKVFAVTRGRLALGWATTVTLNSGS